MSVLHDLELERAASHEAGHAAVFIHLGLRFRHVTVLPSGEGCVEPDLTKVDVAQADAVARKQVVIAYAGGAAQKMRHPKQPDHEVRQCAESDHSQIEGIVKDFPLLAVTLEQCRLEAEFLVEQLSGVIARIARALLERHTVTFKEVEEMYWSTPELSH